MFHRERASAPNERRTPSSPSTSSPSHVPPAVPVSVAGRPAPSSPAAPGHTLAYWQLTRGRLRSFEIPWSDQSDGFNRLLRTLHCERQFDLGAQRDGVGVTVYRCHQPSAELSFQFLVTLNTGTQPDTILVEDLPDLLAFLDQLAPIIELVMKTRTREEQLAARPAQDPGA